MPTTNQLVRRGRPGKLKKTRTKGLKGKPMASAVVMKAGIIKPKKPNSAERKVCRVRMSTGAEVTVHIPGEGHNIQEHSRILVRGGRVKDLPGVHYKAVRGAMDLNPPSSVEHEEGKPCTRMQARSKFGQPKKI